MIRRLLLLGALALASGAAVRWMGVPPAVATAPTPADTPHVAATTAAGTNPAADRANGTDPGDVRPGWQVVWTRPAPGLTDMDLAADGRSVTWVDKKGGVRLMDAATGRTVWQTAPMVGVNQVAAVSGGRAALSGTNLPAKPPVAVLAYSHLNPAAPVVHVLRNARRPGVPPPTPLPCRVDGAVWRVAVSPQGDRALIGTGKRSLYLLPLAVGVPAPATGSKPAAAMLPPNVPLRRWRAPGIPDSLALTSREPLALLGTWQEAGVSAYSLDGTPRWDHDEPDPARLHDVHLSGDGRTAVAVSATGPREDGVRLQVWDAETGRTLWTAALDSASFPHVLVSHNGESVAVTYLKTLPYRTGSVAEHKLVLFDRTGQPRFREKGSGFFSPQSLLALSADGSRVSVWDGVKNTLYTLDASHGAFVAQTRLSVGRARGTAPAIRDAIATPDGRWLLLRRGGDGQISLLKAVAAAATPTP